MSVYVIWSGKRGSNPRHPPWQGGALPLSYSRRKAKDSRGSGGGQASAGGARSFAVPPQ